MSENSTLVVRMSLEECSQATHLSIETLVELVEHGIVRPEGEAPPQWRFDAVAVVSLRRAYRLRRDLELDWPATALALELLDEVERLREENRRLHSRLRRFLD